MNNHDYESMEFNHFILSKRSIDYSLRSVESTSISVAFLEG